MKIFINRDSVCAGDDFDSHDEMRRYAPQMHFGAVISSIVASRFLPDMSKACWIVEVDTKAVGVLSTSNRRVLYAINARQRLEEVCQSDGNLYFRYVCLEAEQTFGETFAGVKATSYQEGERTAKGLKRVIYNLFNR